MSELRFDAIHRNWVIIADERSRRPREFDLQVTSRPEVICPFCPGHEHMTPEPILTVNLDHDTAWQMRLLPNRYPSVTDDPNPLIEIPDLHHAVEGFGRHEVLVETPLHTSRHSEYSPSSITRILMIYRSRMRELMANEKCAHVAIFANSGFRAGATLSHPHSQIVGLPVVPTRAATQLQSGLDHLKKSDSCIYCDMIESELRAEVRIIYADEDFVALVPYVSRFPYESLILPRRHEADFKVATDETLEKLAGLLKQFMEGVDRALNRPAYNIIVHSLPGIADVDPETASRAGHWYLEVIPRIGSQAGLEWGSGMHINSVPPEIGAGKLRDAVSAISQGARG